MNQLAIVQIDDELNVAPGEPRSENDASSWLAPSKLAARKLAAKSVIEWLVRRVSEAELVDGIVVVMPNQPHYRELAGLVPSDIPCHFSDKATPLARLADAAEEFPCNAIIRVPADAPFCDPVLIDRLVVNALQHPEKDFIGYRFEDGSAACRSNVGLFAAWIRTPALKRANREVKSEASAYIINNSFLDYPELFDLMMLPVPKSLDRDDVRFAVHSEADWEELLHLVDALGSDDLLHWQEMVRLIEDQPPVRSRMAQRNKLIA